MSFLSKRFFKNVNAKAAGYSFTSTCALPLSVHARRNISENTGIGMGITPRYFIFKNGFGMQNIAYMGVSCSNDIYILFFKKQNTAIGGAVC